MRRCVKGINRVQHLHDTTHDLVWLQGREEYRTVVTDGPRLSTLGIAGKGKPAPRGQLLSPRHLSSLRNMRKFIPMKKDNRRARSEARTEAGSIGDPMVVGSPGALRPTESTPDLGVGPSTLPTSGPPVSGDQESNSAQTCFFLVIHLTALSCPTQATTPPPISSDRFSNQEKEIARTPQTTSLIQEQRLRAGRSSSPTCLPQPGLSLLG